MQNAIQKALKLAGNQKKLAELVGISSQALGRQIKRDRILPDHCITIERCFPGEINRYELNPEHFGSAVPGAECVVIVLQKYDSKRVFI